MISIMAVSGMAHPAGKFALARAILSNPQILKARPSVNWFLCRYLRKFTVIDVGGRLIVHSHLPPLNSKAYARFVDEHLVARTGGPSHAQIGVTAACPQGCEYCYNRNRAGREMDAETITRVIRGLKSMGVFWIGLTGGEPLLNKNIVRIVESVGEDCVCKLFTTGHALSRGLASDLKAAGLLYVSVSLDHWREEEHDRSRRYSGAYRTALGAIETLLAVDGIHVSVSAVLSREMLEGDLVEEFLLFLQGLGIHEAWLSEAKPAVQAFCRKDLVITGEERRRLIELQDRCNRYGPMTVNYLGHFEDAVHFGCTAGHKMVYVDAFGEISPCVFIPMTFGNVQKKSLREIVADMRTYFPLQDCCFINANYGLFQKYSPDSSLLRREDSLKILGEVPSGQMGRFFRLQYRNPAHEDAPA